MSGKNERKEMQIPKLDLTETPGIYYSLAYGLGALLFIHMNRQRQSRFRYVVSISEMMGVPFALSF